MTIREMHYDFKTKLNKVDSQQYRNLRVPEIDWKLNEAQELFVKMVAKPRIASYLGFETSQRTIDDIRTVVVKDYSSSVVNNVVTLPADYLFYVKASVLMDKGNCTGIKGKFKLQQHDDEFEESEFDKSSFEWRHVNGVFFENGIKLYDDGTFTNTNFVLDYIKKLPYIHNAQDFLPGATYTLPSGIVLTGGVDSPLPEQTHREIVDLAVAIAAEELQNPNFALKFKKLNLNGLG